MPQLKTALFPCFSLLGLWREPGYTYHDMKMNYIFKKVCVVVPEHEFIANYCQYM